MTWSWGSAAVKALAVRLEQTGAGPAAPPGQRAAARWVCTAVEAA